ncbi:P-loop NTPase fold protein [Bacillus paranthracis]|uniref:P-loop NTPase fold protein n=1 Tax=Bacillus paranthracis TaxID=2026186 RepID=UPI00298D3D8A|nr:P-loop NTPase fold protein [Bacillus paranthracis]
MNRHCNKTKEYLKKTFVILLVFILLFNIAVIKNLIKEILIFIQGFELINFELMQIKNYYFFLRKYALTGLVFCVISFLGVNLYLHIRNYFKNPKRFELNSFEESLNKYITDKPNGKGYLVTGEWGSGKTHIVTDFFDKYYKFSNKSVYRISCFGLDSRKLILDEIKNQIEVNDNSLFNWIQYVPVIGKPLFSMLKGSYSLNSIPKGSIFIFDDFERITSLGIDQTGKMQESYKKKHFMLQSSINTSEFKDINDEFKKIENAFKKYDENNRVISITDNLQKYNVATGLVNELIENYKIKVIIICNVDILGYSFVDKVFRGKLDCITFNQSINKNSISNIFNSEFNNQVFSNTADKELISDVLNHLVLDFEKVWSSNGNSNLREIKSVAQAFLDTANIISSKVNLDENYLFSLFYNIYIVKVLRDRKELENLDHFLIGGNLAFFLKLYEKHPLFDSLKSSDYFYRLKWTGIPIAGFWMLNIKKPDNINNLMRYYMKYEYNDLETALLKPDLHSDDRNFGEGKVLLEHLMYSIKTESWNHQEERTNYLDNLNTYIKDNIKFIIDYNHNPGQSIEEKVRNLLVRMNSYFRGAYNPSALEKWWAVIYEYSKVESIPEEENIFIIELYNQFVLNNNTREEELV